MRAPPVLLVILLWPVGEIMSMLAMAEAIGALPTFALIVLGVLAGAGVLRFAGRTAVAELRSEAFRKGAIDPRIFVGASKVALAGLLLIVPGFLSDAAAIYLGATSLTLSPRRWRPPPRVIDVPVERRLDDNRPGGPGF